MGVRDGRDLLTQVAEATALREGEEGVASVLRLIYGAGSLPLKALSLKSRLPVPVLAALRRELEARKVLERRGGLALTDRGRRFVEDVLQVKTRHDPACPLCRGRGLLVDQDTFRPVLGKLESYFQDNPEVDVTLDQAPCLPETALRRALFMYQAGALEGKDVVFLGDDDSVSLAAGLLARGLGEERLARRLTVLEVDERRLEHLRRVSQLEDLGIELLHHDLRDPLPEALRGQFDTFETDPSYTLSGAKLFLCRALDALRPGLGQQGFLSFGAKSPAETLDLHSALVELGLAVHRVVPSFNDYEGASLLGGSSQLLHLLTTPKTRSPVSASRWDEPIYTGDVRPKIRLYRCLGCGSEHQVGKSRAFLTIESLKREGCPSCGNESFLYVRRIDYEGEG